MSSQSKSKELIVSTKAKEKLPVKYNESSVLDLVDKTRDNQKKVFAVGTTTTRALETAYLENLKNGYSGYTKLFIYPGYKFKVVDRLITNFHMPQSSLLMLVSAFIGFDNMKHIYKTAIEERYRFLSYGDVMLLNKNEI